MGFLENVPIFDPISTGIENRNRVKAEKYGEKQAKDARSFAQIEAEKNRQWQQNMSNSAYQRSAADMRKAGLNPLMMYAKGGGAAASSPSGATASASMASGVQGKSGPSAKTNLGGTLLSKYQIEQAKAQTIVAQETAATAQEQEKLNRAVIKLKQRMPDQIAFKDLSGSGQLSGTISTAKNILSWLREENKKSDNVQKSIDKQKKPKHKKRDRKDLNFNLNMP